LYYFRGLVVQNQRLHLIDDPSIHNGYTQEEPTTTFVVEWSRLGGSE